MEIFDTIAPVDNRYFDPECAEYLSDAAFLKYKIKVELALIKTLWKRRLCTKAVYQEIEKACKQITPSEVAIEEERISHDVRAMVNCIKGKLSDKAKPYVHMFATSSDIVCTANALRFKEITNNVLFPALCNLESTLIDIAEKFAATPQIGRTHRQHAVPITFGFAIAQYVDRLGGLLEQLICLTNLPGKFSGACGAYNALSLSVDDPEEFEKELLLELGLHPARISTQITPPEEMISLLSHLRTITGVMANLARDIRGLQQTEVAEVSESFGANQVGSSTMPQKRNPISFERVESLWKIIFGRLETVYLDQISDFQRDLTNSASSRTYGEIFAYFVAMTNGLTKALANLSIDAEKMEYNLRIQGDLILAEPLYIILSSLGHPNAHEAIRVLAQEARDRKLPITMLIACNPDLEKYTDKMTEKQKGILKDPKHYTGVAKDKALKVAKYWHDALALFATYDLAPMKDIAN
ncbi:MAG: adenylosuccinate lyase [Candidatus Vogelbacteria bacterium]|nr:adenylosuccinate lyase [Candidatus Vogelbacteria bacterium]